MTFPLTRSRSRARFFGVPFSPASLFANGEQGAWYDPSDLSTLFTDAAGTTPVTAVEQAVGLMLDKRVPVQGTGYYSGVFDGSGDYLTVPNNAAFALPGDFTVEFWLYANNLASNPTFFTLGNYNAPNNGFSIYQSASLRVFSNGALLVNGSSAMSNGIWYHIALVRSGSGSNNLTLYLNGTSIGTATSTTSFTGVAGNGVAVGADYAGSYVAILNGYISNLRIVKGTAVYTSAFTPPTAPLTAISGTSLLTCQNNYFKDNSSNAFAITRNGDAAPNTFNPFNSATAQTINNAYQSTGTAQPILRARYNLLTQTEAFNTSPWTNLSNVSVTADQILAPDGTLTADTITENTATSGHWIRTEAQLLLASSGCTYSVYAKNNNARYITLSARGAVSNYIAATFDLTGTGAVTSTSNLGSGFAVTVGSTTIAALADGWYRCVLTGTMGSNVSSQSFFIALSDGVSSYTSDGVISYTGTSRSAYIWGAQLLTAADVTATGNVYQRVAAATVYDTSNAVWRPYLAASLSAMQTASINPGSVDKAQVFAGVTKLADAFRILCEFGSDVTSVNGTFAVYPGTVDLASAGSRGTTFAQVTGASGSWQTPGTVVITGLGDISAPQVSIRTNGTQVNTTTSQGTGNYTTQPLNILARNNGASLPFTGRLYSMIVRFGPNLSAGEISSTEAWVNGKTGAY